MTPSQPDRPHRVHTRRWRVLPAARIHADRPTGADVLNDCTGDLAVVLWRTLRAVHLWAAAAPCDRKELFAPGAQEQRLAEILAASPDAALEPPLITLSEMLGKPDRFAVDRVGLACTRIADWAESRGMPGVYAEFTHAATSACPGNPVYALASARVCRDGGAYVEAEAGYQRAIGLARQIGDWDSYTRAHAALGKIAQARGAYPTARRGLVRALRAAERRGLRELRAMVLHDLFVVEMDSQQDEQAEQYAEASLHAYHVLAHRNLPVLVADVAIYWLARGRFGEALGVLLRVLPRMEGATRLAANGNIARAAGAVGDQGAYEAASREVIAAPAENPRKADSLRGLAQGAVSLERWDEAEKMARWSLELATARRENRTVFEAEAILESVGRLRQASAPTERVAPEVEEVAKCGTSSLFQTVTRVLPAQAVGV